MTFQKTNKKLFHFALAGSAACLGFLSCAKAGNNGNTPAETGPYPINVKLNIVNTDADALFDLHTAIKLKLQNNDNDTLSFYISDIQGGKSQSFATRLPSGSTYTISSLPDSSPYKITCSPNTGAVGSVPVNTTIDCTVTDGMPRISMQSVDSQLVFSQADPNSFRKQPVTFKFYVETAPEIPVVIDFDPAFTPPSGWDMSVTTRTTDCDHLTPGNWCAITVKGILPMGASTGSFKAPVKIQNAFFDPNGIDVNYKINP